MSQFGRNNILIITLLLTAFFSGCKSGKKAKDVLFETLDNKRTGIDFSNDLSYNQQFNLFKYMYHISNNNIVVSPLGNASFIINSQAPRIKKIRK